jgi:hypothetical protein
MVFKPLNYGFSFVGIAVATNDGIAHNLLRDWAEPLVGNVLFMCLHNKVKTNQARTPFITLTQFCESPIVQYTRRRDLSRTNDMLIVRKYTANLNERNEQSIKYA